MELIEIKILYTDALLAPSDATLAPFHQARLLAACAWQKWAVILSA